MEPTVWLRQMTQEAADAIRADESIGDVCRIVARTPLLVHRAAEVGGHIWAEDDDRGEGDDGGPAGALVPA